MQLQKNQTCLPHFSHEAEKQRPKGLRTKHSPQGHVLSHPLSSPRSPAAEFPSPPSNPSNYKAIMSEHIDKVRDPFSALFKATSGSCYIQEFQIQSVTLTDRLMLADQGHLQGMVLI